VNTSAEERKYLRELAEKCREIAALPVMAERRKRWLAHNRGEITTPLIVVEEQTFVEDILPPLKCTDPATQAIERQLLTAISVHELIDDDKVAGAEFIVPLEISFSLFNLTRQREFSKDSNGRTLGYHDKPFLTGLEGGLPDLPASAYGVSFEKTHAARDLAEDLIGDILPVKIKNQSMCWRLGLTMHLIELMGMENLFLALMDTPDEVKKLVDRIADELIGLLRWQESEGLLTLNNGNDYAGAGSYGFSDELPAAGFPGKVRLCDQWCNLNSQETVGVSPDVYKEVFFPAYERIAALFGLVYYGCCEPVHEIWNPCLSSLSNLRKVSISPWCNEEMMGESLRGSKIIYSRKPSPVFLGVEGSFDETLYAEHIRKTLKAAAGCPLELIHRDIYTLSGDRQKAGRAVKLIRSLL
jgi:hypothetical protein